MFKRSAVLLLVLSALLSTAGPATADPGVYAGAQRYASAMWLYETSRTAGVLYVVDAVNDVSPHAGASSVAYIGKIPCTIERSRYFTIIFCAGAVEAIELDPLAFQMDPLLRNAELTVRQDRFNQRVTWVGQRTLPDTGQGAWVSDYFIAAGAGVGRWAPASATLFGAKHKARGSEGFLVMGADAYVFPSLETPSVRRTPQSDGSLLYEVSLSR